jgi:hypothetical protein
MSQEIQKFTEEQQAAVIGHAFTDQTIWGKLDALKVDDKWFDTAAIADLYKNLTSFRRAFKRGPGSGSEFLDYVKDSLIQEASKRAMKVCMASKAKHTWEILETKIVSWAAARLIYTGGQEVNRDFNANKIQSAIDKYLETADKLRNIDSIVGVKKDGFRSAADRCREEAKHREEDNQAKVPYALSFLQDLLRGILPSQVVLLGAAPGSGKTELAKTLASHVAMQGKRVHYFALEAKDEEIEQRIKFGLMGGWYKDEYPGIPIGDINYQRWLHQELNGKLDPYLDKAQEFFDKNYKSLYIRYKVYDEFGMSELEQGLLDLKGKSDFIVIDHIHYVDLPGQNENVELQKVIQAIKNISAIIKTPIVCVAHVRKGVKALMPALEDFHGTSSLTKIALTAIMIAKAPNLVTQDKHGFGWPTLVRVLKCRENGSASDYTGVCFFNYFTNEYTPYYAVGKLNPQGTKWTPCTGDFPWWANKDRLVTNIMEYSIA